VDASWFDPRRGAVLSYVSLRRTIGLIGIGLPFGVSVGALVLGQRGLLSSVSAYYYSPTRDVFVAALVVVGAFLLSYRFGRLDDLLGDVAGVAAIGVALFPTTPGPHPTGRQQAAGILHIVSAGVLFVTLAVFSLFLFTRTAPGSTPSPKKRMRNAVYRVSGIVMLASLALSPIAGLTLSDATKARLHPTFWAESLAIFSFGVSWTVKGRTFLTDDAPPRRPGRARTRGRR
jgi:hypothetical protein